MASTMFWPCETSTSTCRSFATISSGLYRFLAIAVLLDVKDIPQLGPPQWGWITTVSLSLPRSNSSIRKERLDEKIRSVAAPCHLVRPYPAAISSSLLLIFSFRVWGHLGRGKGVQSHRGS